MKVNLELRYIETRSQIHPRFQIHPNRLEELLRCIRSSDPWFGTSVVLRFFIRFDCLNALYL